jgi:hypothetical protein
VVIWYFSRFGILYKENLATLIQSHIRKLQPPRMGTILQRAARASFLDLFPPGAEGGLQAGGKIQLLHELYLGSGTDVLNIFAEKFSKKLAFLTQNKVKLCKNLIIHW